MYTDMYRQGDILFSKLDRDVPPRPHADMRKPVNGRLVVAEGEVTGHTHGFDLDEEDGPTVQMFTQTGWDSRGRNTEATYLRIVGGPATLTHDEHDPFELTEGTYLVSFQREYDPAQRSVRVYD